MVLETIAVSKRQDGQLAVITRPPGLRAFVIPPEAFCDALLKMSKKTGLISPISAYGFGTLTIPESMKLGMLEWQGSHTHMIAFLKLLEAYEVQ